MFPLEVLDMRRAAAFFESVHRKERATEWHGSTASDSITGSGALSHALPFTIKYM